MFRERERPPLVVAGVHVAALTEPGLCRRIHAGTERIHKIKSFSLERADVLAKQGEDQRLLRFQYLKATKQDPAQSHPDEADGEQDAVAAKRHVRNADDAVENSQHIQQKCQQQYCHSVLLGSNNLFLHVKPSFALGQKNCPSSRNRQNQPNGIKLTMNYVDVLMISF